MSAAFDPYHRWLGIPPEEQPPHHYRLLGVKALEEDLDAIENAAEQRMKHLRDFQTGKHAELSQKLLNEVAAARVTLLDPAKKAAYDAELRAELAPVKKPAERTLRTAKPLEEVQPRTAGAAAGLPAAAGSADDQVLFSASFARPAPRRGAGLPAAVMIGAAALVLLLLLVVGGGAALWLMLASPSEVAVSAPPPSAGGALAAPPASGATDTEAAKQPAESSDPPAEGASGSAESPAPETEPPLRDPLPENPLPPDASDDPEPAAPAGSEEPSQPAGVEDPPETPSEGEAAPRAPRKLPVPDKAARDEKRKQIAAIFPVDKAKTFEEKGSLAADLIRTARDTQNDPVAQFALLNLAREQAAEAGQIKLAFEAIDALDEIFEFDAGAVRVASLDQAAKAAIPPAAKREIVTLGMQMVDQFAASDDFDRAAALSTRMATLARGLRDAELTRSVADQRKSVDSLAADYKKSKDAFEKLKTAPDDPEANLAAGRYLAFVKQDWDAGVAHLAKGSDALLSAAAKAELAQPQAAADIEKLADAWWAAAEGQKDASAKGLCRARAGEFYRQIVDDLSGLAKVKIEQRIRQGGEIAAARPPHQPSRVPARDPRRPQPLPENLLALVDAERHALRQKWVRNGDEIIAPQAYASLLKVPVIVDGSYELNVEFTRNTGGDIVGLIIPVGPRHCSVQLSVSGGECGGIEQINGEGVGLKNPSRFAPSVLKNNQRYSLQVRVNVRGESAAIAVSLDGTPLTSWTGPIAALNVADVRRLPEPGRIGLYAHESKTTFHAARLTMLTGKSAAAPDAASIRAETGTSDLGIFSRDPAEPGPPPKGAEVVYLDDLAEAGSNIENGKLGKHGDTGGFGSTWTLDGKRPAHALSMHAGGDAHVSYTLDGRYDSFAATAALWEDPKFPGSRAASAVTFKVLGDGKVLWQSAPLQDHGKSEECEVAIRGVRTLRLQVEAAGNPSGGRAVWVNPRITPAAAKPGKPKPPQGE